MTHICVSKLSILGSDNGLSPGRRQAINWTNAGIWLIGPLGTNFSEIFIGIQTFSFKKMHLKMSSAKWRPLCLGLNVLIDYTQQSIYDKLQKSTMKLIDCSWPNWSLIKRVLLTISQHWLRYWVGAQQATIHYLSRWWPSCFMQCGTTKAQWVIILRYTNPQIYWLFIFSIFIFSSIGLTKELLECLLGCACSRNVHKLADIVDDMSAHQDVTAKVTAIHATDGDRWTVQFIVREFLEKTTTVKPLT